MLLLFLFQKIYTTQENLHQNNGKNLNILKNIEKCYNNLLN